MYFGGCACFNKYFDEMDEFIKNIENYNKRIIKFNKLIKTILFCVNSSLKFRIVKIHCYLIS